MGVIKGGVPRGSVFGPLFFLLYINDMADNTSSLSRLFAADTSLPYASKNTDQIEERFNSDLEKINSWSKQWLVNFNPQKTEFSTNRELTNILIFFRQRLSLE